MVLGNLLAGTLDTSPLRSRRLTLCSPLRPPGLMMVTVNPNLGSALQTAT